MRLSLLDRKNRVLMPGVFHFFGDDPVELVRGSGTRVWDSGGREYLDFYAGVGVNSLGHCHPEVVEAVERQQRTLQHTTTIHLSKPMIELAERLVEVAPKNLSRVFFCADGSGANDGALVAARRATGRPDFIAFDRGLHGRTSLTMAATGLPMWRADPFPPAQVHHLPTPLSQSPAMYAEELNRLIDSARPNSIAAMIAEPVLGNGGVIVPPPGYFETIKPILKDHGILLIADEVQTGFCRTGRWFGIEHWNARPDIMSVAKALGNGYPVAGWLATESVALACSSPMASTFGGNLPAMAAGLKVIEIMERDGLASEAKEKGARFVAAIAPALDHSAIVRQIRGLGLMIGVEMLNAAACEVTLKYLRQQGVLAGKSGLDRDVLTFEPPLITSYEEIDQVAAIVCEGIESLEGAVPCV